MNKEPNCNTPKVIGHVSFDVFIECPHCNGRLNLNDYPYNDETTDYSLTEDELGLALFGTETESATWKQLKIEYKCCLCKTPFVLSGFDI
jgi:DNA-directed RNA polymerase subunit RPC12/RpoP